MAKLLLGITGGIAAYKAASLVRLFKESGHEVRVVTTKNAERFIGVATLEALSGHKVHSDLWDDVAQVQHISLAKWADLMVVAPATASFISRYAVGQADDLLLNILIATTSPVAIAPAMHTEMWKHEATQSNLQTLQQRGVTVIEPEIGRLTGADSGVGRLPEPETIFERVNALLTSNRAESRDFVGRRVVVTAGGTREPLDPVRFFGNRSSGKQGLAIAARAAARGAEVTLIGANISLTMPAGVTLISVGTALELRDAVLPLIADADLIVMAAAVADYRPKAASVKKIKKSSESLTVELVPNPDIASELAASKPADCKIIAFAAETDTGDALLALATEKMKRKGVDLMVANSVSDGQVFDSDQNSVVILGTAGVQTEQSGTKIAIADHILDAAKALWH